MNEFLRKDVFSCTLSFFFSVCNANPNHGEVQHCFQEGVDSKVSIHGNFESFLAWEELEKKIHVFHGAYIVESTDTQCLPLVVAALLNSEFAL